MSREIKFRAWDQQTGVMYYSDHEKTVWAGGLGGCVIAGNNQSLALTLPVMQYTGLKDKNGEELYDQDIIQTDQGTLFIIEFNQQEMQWVLYQANDGTHRDLQGDIFALKYYMVPNITLKGNCYEHPELLKP